MPQPFAIQPDLAIHMYCSEAPCTCGDLPSDELALLIISSDLELGGDASMELIMAAQGDPTPWKLSKSGGEGVEESQVPLHGRGYFSELGIVRTKPSRADAPRTLSKSCSDKLALKQCTSLLSSIAALLICPENAYLDTLIVPSSQRSPAACSRAFGSSGRMSKLAGTSWAGGYSFRPFRVMDVQREFRYSRRTSSLNHPLIPCNIAALWNPSIQQTIIGGRLAGRRADDIRGATIVSRRALWSVAARVAVKLGIPTLSAAMAGGAKRSYSGLKEHERLRTRDNVKTDVTNSVLRPWGRNVIDDFSLPVEPSLGLGLPDGHR